MKIFFSLIFIIFNAIILRERVVAAEIDLNKKEVILSAAEQPPYLGKDLPNIGYAAQVVTEAYSRVGYKVKINFFPLARANQMAMQGESDGYLAIYSGNVSEADFLLSNSFPAGRFVLMKKAASKLVDTRTNKTDKSGFLKNISKYRVGFTNKAAIPPELVYADQSKKVIVNSDLEGLDMLMTNQLDLMLLDKLTAGDLIAEQRPQYINQLEIFASLSTNNFYIGFPKSSSKTGQLKEEFNHGLQILKKDGTIYKIMYNHGLSAAILPARGNTTLTIGTLNIASMLTLQKLSVEYQKKHPDISFDWRVLDEKTLRLRLLSDLAISDGQYDILTIGAYETPIWAKNNWILPLKNLSPQYGIEDVIKPVRHLLSLDNNLYALPFYAESSMTYYRKDLVANAGLSMPEAPTYNDIKRIAAAIHAPEKQIYGICLRGDPGWGANMALLTTMVNSAGGRWFDERWNPTIDTSEWRLALQTYIELLTLYGPPKPEEQDYAKNLTLFQGGHCGIWIDATVFASALLDPRQSKVADKIGFVRAPVFHLATGSKWLWTWALAIPKSSKTSAEAMKFIEWATSREYIQLVAKKYGWINIPPGTRSSTYEEMHYRTVAPFADAVFRAISEDDINNATLTPRPYIGIQFVEIPEFASIGNNMGRLTSSVLAKKISVDMALKLGQRDAAVQMRESKYIH
ncbi:extracellular solute-binding protein [Undibacterium jejuense]|uniref:Extracellular solute-binding protein n=1 Tax=Undibacterium jejuense TaxID=1344949 RepID=A0A923HM72_9BURK|nr:extracellular solute-binding protein [Undibacterium jejuense]MBC3864287.1 extracellular solute-binding protein [Undibacterium jejuense]